MKREVFLHSLQSVLPAHHLPQEKIVEWIIKSHVRSESLGKEIPDPDKFKRILRHFALTEKHIQERYFECHEVDEDWDAHQIYRLNKSTPVGSEILERNLYFGKVVQRVFADLYPFSTPKHLIHVTCTGYLSPSPPQVFFSGKENIPSITHAYHMGCYAALPAIRMGKAIVLDEDHDVDIVHTEICSLHMNPGVHNPEQIVVQTLFADGHIKYSISQDQKGGFALKVKAIHERLLPDSLNDMTWIPGPVGMMMTLSKEVPNKIRDAIPEFLSDLCLKVDVDFHDVLKTGIFAIHPGGPKIIEAVQKKLELIDEQVSASKKILLSRGNMSSATLPHVWKEIMDSKPKAGTKIVSLAFGPGLTIFGALFEVSA